MNRVLQTLYSVLGEALYTYIYVYMYKYTNTTDGEDRTYNDYDSQKFKQVCTEVPVNFKQIFTGILKISNKFSQKQTGVPVTHWN